uniref:Uncharacterized protein n=1 Tax=Physcomitrium patens TaxID=3218 RepID=A0A2K1LB04_PHYPA|nr:hypothetical protein PHYPA_001634 [Physcomitrium patens]
MRQAYSLSPVSFGCVFPLELWVAEAGDSLRYCLQMVYCVLLSFKELQHSQNLGCFFSFHSKVQTSSLETTLPVFVHRRSYLLMEDKQVGCKCSCKF